MPRKPSFAASSLRLIRLLSLCCAAAAHCAGALAACERVSIPVRGIARHALVCAPAAPKSPSSVVLAFHGRGGNGREMAAGTRLHDAWPEALVAYLDGLPGNPAPYDPPGRYPGWQIDPGDLADRDVAFTDAALDALAQRYRLDPNRIYAAGHSNGARFLGVLWVRRPHRFAALAFSAGQADTLIESAVPLPVFMAMGLYDEVVPFEWQRRSISYAAKRFGIESIEAWRVGEHSARSASGIELVSFIHGGRHGWPDGQTEKIVAFFKRQTARPAPAR